MRVGRHYTAIYVSWPDPLGLRDTGLSFTTLGNLSDSSWMARVDYNVTLLSAIKFRVNVGTSLGRRGIFRFGMKIPAQGEKDPTGGLLARGMRMYPQLVSAGVDLLIDI